MTNWSVFPHFPHFFVWKKRNKFLMGFVEWVSACQLLNVIFSPLSTRMCHHPLEIYEEADWGQITPSSFGDNVITLFLSHIERKAEVVTANPV